MSLITTRIKRLNDYLVFLEKSNIPYKNRMILETKKEVRKLSEIRAKSKQTHKLH